MTQKHIPFIKGHLLSGMRHGFFTRKGGVSKSVYKSLNCSFRDHKDEHVTDSRENVLKNRSLAMHALGVPVHSLQTLRQEHGNKALEVKDPWGSGVHVPVADAMVTVRDDVTLGIQTADCVPLLMADTKHKVIAAVHSGWRSALAGVVENTVHLMKNLGAHPDKIIAVIGPCIHEESYEVGAEVQKKFLDQDKGNEIFFLEEMLPEKILFDLPGYVESRLHKLKIEQVEVLSYDTYENADLFFSCRRATQRGEKDFGGHLSCISLIL